jgi:hypothetical protein
MGVNSAPFIDVLMCFGPSGPPARNTHTSFCEIKIYANNTCTQDYHISDLLLNTLVTYKRPRHNININEQNYTIRPTEETFYSTNIRRLLLILKNNRPNLPFTYTSLYDHRYQCLTFHNTS